MARMIWSYDDLHLLCSSADLGDRRDPNVPLICAALMIWPSAYAC
jgi:hypothetical protein